MKLKCMEPYEKDDVKLVGQPFQVDWESTLEREGQKAAFCVKCTSRNHTYAVDEI